MTWKLSQWLLFKNTAYKKGWDVAQVSSINKHAQLPGLDPKE